MYSGQHILCTLPKGRLIDSAFLIYGIILYRYNNGDFPKEEREKIRNEVMVGRRVFPAARPDFDLLSQELLKRRIARLRMQGASVDTGPAAQEKMLAAQEAEKQAAEQRSAAEQAKAQAEQAKAAAEVTKKSYDRVQRLFNEGVITAQKRDEVFAQYKASEAQEKAAKSQYDMAVEGARAEEKAAAAAQVNRARGAVAEVNSYMRETVQVAQMEGEVSDIYPKVGELVGTGAPIMSIAVMNDMWGTFNVREDQLEGMTVGSEFTAYSPAFKKDLKMKVYYIKDQGSFAVWKATKANGQYDLKTFEVKARPVEKLDGLRPGMSLIIK